jgi:hypothetical protein
MAQITDAFAIMKVVVSPEQRQMLKNQILVMKALMRNQLPTGPVLHDATNIDLITAAKHAKPAGLFASYSGPQSAAVRGRGASPSVLKGRRGGYRGRKKRKSKRQSDEDDDEDEVDEEEGNWKKSRAGSANEIRRSSRGGTNRKVYADNDEDEGEEGDDQASEDSDEPQQKGLRKKKAQRQSTVPSKLTISALDDDDDDHSKSWRVERIMAVRYSDLPDDPADPIDEVAALPPNATEEQQAAAHDRKQYRMRMAMPLEQRRAWESLEFLVRWKGLSYIHVSKRYVAGNQCAYR